MPNPEDHPEGGQPARIRSVPTDLRLDDQLCFALYAATTAITRVYRPLLAGLGLTYPQYLVLLVLWQDGDRTVGEIAERLRLPSHAISPVLDRLNDAGLLTRRRTTEDRRVVQVSLTAAGVAMEPRAAAAQDQVACSTRLGPEQIARLREQLFELTRSLADPIVLAEHGLPTSAGDPREVAS